MFSPMSSRMTSLAPNTQISQGPPSDNGPVSYLVQQFVQSQLDEKDNLSKKCEELLQENASLTSKVAKVKLNSENDVNRLTLRCNALDQFMYDQDIQFKAERQQLQLENKQLVARIAQLERELVDAKAGLTDKDVVMWIKDQVVVQKNEYEKKLAELQGIEDQNFPEQVPPQQFSSEHILAPAQSE